MEETKRCSKCGETKALGEFGKWKGSKSGLQSQCRPCRQAASRIYRAANRDRLNASTKAWREANVEHWKAARTAWRVDNPGAYRAITRRSWLKRKYGLTPETYDNLLAKQGGVCALCGKPPPDGKRLAVDHSHSCCPGETTCGECIRGLLCAATCNRFLGWVDLNLDAVLVYLGKE